MKFKLETWLGVYQKALRQYKTSKKDIETLTGLTISEEVKSPS